MHIHEVAKSGALITIRVDFIVISILLSPTLSILLNIYSLSISPSASLEVLAEGT